jgi:Leucine-rich repeat (LRR) protein
MQTMETEIGKVIIFLAGSGTIAIDWGDGSAIETGKLKVYSKDDWDKHYTHHSDIYEYGHAYTGASSRTITITGDNITNLFCGNILLTGLDVSKNTALTGLDCAECGGLTNLNVSKNTALTELNCTGNQLTGLDVSKNTALTELYCGENQLTGLDVSKNTALATLYCNSNQFSTEALNALFETLHDNKINLGKEVKTGNNPGTDACDISIAEKKGWKVKKSEPWF